MHCTFGQLPDQPCLNRSKQQISALCLFSCSRNVIQDPFYLRTREVCVDYKSCLLSEFLGQSFFFQRVAIFGCSSALPHNGMINWLSCILIPHNRSLSLVRNSDCRNIFCRRSDYTHCLNRNTKLTCPDLICVMLYPARLWEILGEFPLCHTAHFPFFIKKNTPVTRRSCIQSHYIFCHVLFLLFGVPTPCFLSKPPSFGDLIL